MRIHLKIQKNYQVIPFDHQPLLTGVIHKWLGWNEEHGQLSLYSFSNLEGASVTTKGFKFEQDTSFFFSSHQPELIKKMISGIQQDPTMFEGLSVNEIIIEEDPDFSERELFFVASPIFIKRRLDNNIEHITFEDPHAGQYLTETLITKMKKAGLEDHSLMIRFNTDYHKAATRLIDYNGIKNRVSWCPVNIIGKAETKLFAWNTGLGNSTGIGFGAIK